jgi:hypothetical protein
MRRRQLLVGAAGALTASFIGVRAWQENAVVPGLQGWQENVIARIVRTQVPDAQVGDGDMEAFIQAFLAHRRQLDKILAVRAVLAPTSGLLPERLRKRLERLDHQVVSSFLLGTDYFDPDRPSKTVSFIAYPDPYENGCANPLARFDFPSPDQA